MCNCINEIEARLRELPSKSEEWKDREITRADIENVALMIDGPCRTELHSTVRIEYDYVNRKGEKKHKKQSINLSYHFCPFCGERYE